MANWDALTHDVAERFQLGFKANTLVQELLRLIAAERGGVGGFLAKIKAAGFEEKEESWFGEPYPMALSAREARSALGDEAIYRIAKNVGISEGSASRILGYVIPRALGLLREDGALPKAAPSAPAALRGMQMPVHKTNRMNREIDNLGLLAVPGLAVLLTVGVLGRAISTGTADDHAFLQFPSPPIEAASMPSGERSVYAADSGAAAGGTNSHVGASAASLHSVLGPHTVSGDLRVDSGWIENLGAVASGCLGSGNAPTLYPASEFNVGGTVPLEDQASTVGSLYAAEVPQFTVAEIEGTDAPGMRIALLSPQMLSPQEGANTQVASASKAPATKDVAFSLPTITFTYRSAMVPESSHRLLRQVAAQIKQLPRGTVVEVNGYSDSKGRPAFNLKLSQKRAKSVYRLLVRDGVRPAMLEARGYGSSAPLGSANQAGEGRSSTTGENPRDRRVEFRVVPPRS